MSIKNNSMTVLMAAFCLFASTFPSPSIAALFYTKSFTDSALSFTWEIAVDEGLGGGGPAPQIDAYWDIRFTANFLNLVTSNYLDINYYAYAKHLAHPHAGEVIGDPWPSPTSTTSIFDPNHLVGHDQIKNIRPDIVGTDRAVIAISSIPHGEHYDTYTIKWTQIDQAFPSKLKGVILFTGDHEEYIPPTPEINAASTGSALTLLLGSLGLAADRRRRTKSA